MMGNCHPFFPNFAFSVHSLKLTMVRALTPQEPMNTTSQVLPLASSSLTVVRHLSAYLWVELGLLFHSLFLLLLVLAALCSVHG